MTSGTGYFLAAIFGILAIVLLLWRPGPKWWIGVRLPWTYADRQIWDASWVLAGVFSLALAVAALYSLTACFVVLVLFLIACIAYPVYFYWQKYGTLKVWKEVGWIDYRPVVRCRHCGHFQKLPDADQANTAVCEACGLVCRSD
jgi:hypothetical protein